MRLRAEEPADIDAVRSLTARAFDSHPHSDGSEPDIIDRLRAAGALTLSFVALDEADRIIGHIAISPVDWEGGDGWFGLGPVSVAPDRQRQGVGSALIETALSLLRANGAAGCVLAGDPAYYRRFGFQADPRWVYPGLPSEYFLSLSFADVAGAGRVRYHSAFG